MSNKNEVTNQKIKHPSDNTENNKTPTAKNIKTKKIKMLKDYWSTYGVFKEGQTVEVDENIAKHFISDRIAIEIKD